MEIIRRMGSRAEVSVSVEELRTVCNALNEVCNGIELDGEFEIRMGVRVDAARTVLESLQAVLREMADSA